MKIKPLIAARLMLRFTSHCVLSGIATARIILHFTQPPAGLVRLRFAPMSSTGAAVLGALVTLTPGTTVIDIDMAHRDMLLHLLDTRNIDGSLAAIRRDFEADVMALFPKEEA